MSYNQGPREALSGHGTRASGAAKTRQLAPHQRVEDPIGKRIKFGDYGSPSTNARNSRRTSASFDRNM